MISVDAKKTELVGPFKMRVARGAEGKALRYGTYDTGRKIGR